MNRSYHIISLFIALLLMAACNEKLHDIEPLPSENDQYAGNATSFRLGQEAESFDVRNVRCWFRTESGEKIMRTCEHKREKDSSSVHMKIGLKDGTYRLLYFEYDLPEAGQNGRSSTGRFGLGGRIRISNGSVKGIDSFNPLFGMAGKGTAENPYILTTDMHLKKLANIVNSTATNKSVGHDTYFEMQDDIDAWEVSWDFDDGNGWYPIGYTNTLPFRGHFDGKNHRIIDLFSYRDQSVGIGLFGFLQGARIDNVILDRAEIYGYYATGGIAGVVVAAGGNRDASSINFCKVINSRIAGSEESGDDVDENSLAVGGILGAVDQNAIAFINGCHIDENTTITGGYGIGGILGTGNMYSTIQVADCSNKATVKGAFSAVGGIIGSADTVSVVACENLRDIAGAIRYSGNNDGNIGISVGGIIGGAGCCKITACRNIGNINGNDGVGGILGSTRLGNEDGFMYNTAYIQFCSNSGNINGKSYVGGICGEAQLGGYALCNSGDVSGNDFTGGVAGNTSSSVVFNSLNSGNINGNNFVSGIIGQAAWATLAMNQNYGAVTGKGDNVGGIAARVGDNTYIHYCQNTASITSNGKNPKIGGIVGEIGDPSEWTAGMTAGIIIGMAEILTPCFTIPASLSITGSKLFMGLFNAALGLIWTPLDVTSNILGVVSLFSDYEVTDLNNQINESISEIGNTVTAELQAIRQDNNIWSGYTASIDSFREICEAKSKPNIETVCNNMNTIRNERAEAVAGDRKQKKVVHTAIGGACIVIGAVASIIAAIPTGGASIWVECLTTAAAVTATTTSIVGGVNGMVQTISEYTDHSILVTQCVNSGTITTNHATSAATAFVGGITGLMFESCYVRDCLNTGNHKGSNVSHGQLAGGAHKGSVVSDSFVIGKTDSWNGFVGKYVDCASIDMSGLYFYKNASNISLMYERGNQLDSDKCGDASCYSGWSINGEGTLWQIQNETSPNHPIPHNSEAVITKSTE